MNTEKQDVYTRMTNKIVANLTALKNDKRAIFSAAAHAQRAVEFLLL